MGNCILSILVTAEVAEGTSWCPVVDPQRTGLISRLGQISFQLLCLGPTLPNVPLDCPETKTTAIEHSICFSLL